MTSLLPLRPWIPQATRAGALALLGLALALTWGAWQPSRAEAQPIPVPGDNARPPTPQKGEGWLGVALTMFDEAKAKELGLKRAVVGVESVFDGSPAASSGFLAGDAILSFNGKEVKETKELIELVRGTEPGARVIFEVVRGKERLKMPLLLGVRPDRMEMLRSQLMNKPAPDFAVQLTSTGKPTTLKEHRGKVIVLDFWATWCGPCRKSIPEMNALAERHQGEDFVLLGISDEEATVLQGFTAKTPLKYATATDTKRQANKDYKINALPTTVVIDQAGIIRDVFIGAGDLKALQESVDKLLGKPL